MSIVNISSENALENTPIVSDGRYNNSEFTVKFKKPLNDCVGIHLLRAAIPLTYNVININEDINGNFSNVLRFLFQRTVDFNLDSNTQRFNHVLESSEVIRNWTIVMDSRTPDKENIDELCEELERKLRMIDLTIGGSHDFGGTIDNPSQYSTLIGNSDVIGQVQFPGWGTSTIKGAKQRENAITIAKTGLYNYEDTMNSFLCFFNDLTHNITIIHKAKRFYLMGYNYVDKQTKEINLMNENMKLSSEFIGFDDGLVPVDVGELESNTHHLPNYPGNYAGDNPYYGTIFNDSIKKTRYEQHTTDFNSQYLLLTDEYEESIIILEQDKWLWIGATYLEFNDSTKIYDDVLGIYEKDLHTIGYRRELISLQRRGIITVSEMDGMGFTLFESAYSKLLEEHLYYLVEVGVMEESTRDIIITQFLSEKKLSFNRGVEQIIIDEMTPELGFTGILDSTEWIYNPVPSTLKGEHFLYYLQSQVIFSLGIQHSLENVKTYFKDYRTVLNGFTVTDYTDNDNIDIMNNELSNGLPFHSNQLAKAEAAYTGTFIHNIVYGKSFNEIKNDVVERVMNIHYDTFYSQAQTSANNYISHSVQLGIQKSTATTLRTNEKQLIINTSKYIYTTPAASDVYFNAIEEILSSKLAPYNQSSGRLQKVFGFYYDDYPSSLSNFYLNDGNIDSNKLDPTVNGIGNVAVMKSHLRPEPRGSKALFLRIIGPTLDQQNTETDTGDRIMIPLTVPHGEVQYYTANTQAEIIPFKVPVSLTNLKLRLEYGDENSLVGGSTNSLNGAHAYYRFKFYFKHQTNKA